MSLRFLHEINFGDCRSCKTAIFFAILGTVNCINLANFSLQKVQKFMTIKIQSLKTVKIVIFEYLNLPKIDFTFT